VIRGKWNEKRAINEQEKQVGKAKTGVSYAPGVAYVGLLDVGVNVRQNVDSVNLPDPAGGVAYAVHQLGSYVFELFSSFEGSLVLITYPYDSHQLSIIIPTFGTSQEHKEYFPNIITIPYTRLKMKMQAMCE
jgi:hypothetical protein